MTSETCPRGSLTAGAVLTAVVTGIAGVAATPAWWRSGAAGRLIRRHDPGVTTASRAVNDKGTASSGTAAASPAS